MFKSVVTYGDAQLGEVEIFPQNSDIKFDEVRISQFSMGSKRCPPLAVFHVISPKALAFKMEGKSEPLLSMHSACLKEKKTAVMLLRKEEIHLVAMPSKKNREQYSSFWGFNVTLGLYNSCIQMLNIRCLSIVFDLDETLVVANSMRSFKDKIAALEKQKMCGIDMSDKIKRYLNDKHMLQQYLKKDQVFEKGKVIKAQPEVVTDLSNNHSSITRPIIRLQDRNIILTRINPKIRDTSMLVKLRPGWEDLQSYLTKKGRNLFKVYVCTRAGKDYALEMWRLLDPEFKLINSNELQDRIVCVKNGSRKSLLRVFQDGSCHPKMALVVDDRKEVWEEIDQPRVYNISPFSPYCNQTEINRFTKLSVAKLAAWLSRLYFFRELDGCLLRLLSNIFYEDSIADVPSPDVSNHLISEDAITEGLMINDPQLETLDILQKAVASRNYHVMDFYHNNLPQEASSLPLGHIGHLGTNSQGTFSREEDEVFESELHHDTRRHHNNLPEEDSSLPLDHIGHSGTNSQGTFSREEGEVFESELHPDTRRRVLILRHGTVDDTESTSQRVGGEITEPEVDPDRRRRLLIQQYGQDSKPTSNNPQFHSYPSKKFQSHLCNHAHCENWLRSTSNNHFSPDGRKTKKLKTSAISVAAGTSPGESLSMS